MLCGRQLQNMSMELFYHKMKYKRYTTEWKENIRKKLKGNKNALGNKAFTGRKHSQDEVLS